MPPPKTWKAIERKVAAAFGCKRQRLSGSSGRDDETASDTTHPILFIEVKYRKEHATFNLFRATEELAEQECKIPVVIMVESGKPGFLVCCHSSDMKRIADEMVQPEGTQ